MLYLRSLTLYRQPCRSPRQRTSCAFDSGCDRRDYVGVEERQISDMDVRMRAHTPTHMHARTHTHAHAHTTGTVFWFACWTAWPLRVPRPGPRWPCPMSSSSHASRPKPSPPRQMAKVRWGCGEWWGLLRRYARAYSPLLPTPCRSLRLIVERVLPRVWSRPPTTTVVPPSDHPAWWCAGDKKGAPARKASAKGADPKKAARPPSSRAESIAAPDGGPSGAPAASALAPDVRACLTHRQVLHVRDLVRRALSEVGSAIPGPTAR